MRGLSPEGRAAMEHLDVMDAIKRGDIHDGDLAGRPVEPPTTPALNPKAAWPFPAGARGEKVKRK